jgi:hypothetical protein
VVRELGTTGVVVPDQFNEEGWVIMRELAEKYYRLLIPRRLGPTISVPARHTAVLGMAIHADRMGEAVRYP